MKIAIVLNTSWNVWNFRRGLVKNFIRQGHEVLIIAPEDQFTEKIIQMGCRHISVRMDSRGVNPLKDLALFLELLAIYFNHSPDLILHYTVKPNIYGSIAAGILGIKNIPNVCGLGTLFLNPGITTQVAMKLYKIAFKFPYRVFFQNVDDQEFFIENNLIQEHKCLQLPGSGVDTEYFRPMPTRLKEKVPLKFLMIARVILDKGVHEFISAAHSLRARGLDAKFIIAGQLDPNHKRGISKAKFKEWLDWSGVEYLGFQEDLRKQICSSDVVVLPSYREGTPKSLLEAAACGRPLIATNVAGCKQVVTDKHNGFLCKPRSAYELAKAMEKFYYLDGMVRRQMGRNSRKSIEERFDEGIIISSYNNLIDRVELVPPDSIWKPIKEEKRQPA